MIDYRDLVHTDAENDSIVSARLDVFLTVAAADGVSLSLDAWVAFYDFAIASYEASESERFRLSQLADILRAHKLPNPGRLAITYAHILYAIARKDGQYLYLGGFNP